jgi:hypothetical protein
MKKQAFFLAATAYFDKVAIYARRYAADDPEQDIPDRIFPLCSG